MALLHDKSHSYFAAASALALCLVLAALAVEAVFFRALQPATTAKAVTLACGCCLFGVLLQPRSDGLKGAERRMLLWAMVVAAGYGLLTLTLYRETMGNALRLSCGVFAVTAVTGSLLTLVSRLSSDLSVTQACALLMLSVAAAAPIYAGPLAVLWSESPWLVNGIVAVSPVSFLSCLVNFDYLRQPWFYEHAAFGGLRFEYPSPGIATGCYLTLAGVLLVLQRVPGRNTADNKERTTI